MVAAHPRKTICRATSRRAQIALRLLVTGLRGQVVESLKAKGASGNGHSIIAVGRPELDLASPGDVKSVLSRHRPDAVVNAAAYTAVDRAEKEEALAFAVNAAGADAIAEASAGLGVPLIHISTDYVFPGDKPTPYSEEDETGPQGVYGRSKLAGEKAVRAAQPRHAILRTAWVYSPFGANFVKTMLRLAATQDQIRVVADQSGNPTSALDLAEAIIVVAEAMLADAHLSGIYHVAGTGDSTWCAFARHILEVSGKLGGPTAEVLPISTAEYPTPAKRPVNSRLNCGKFAHDFGRGLPHWQESSAACVGQLLQNHTA